MPVASGAAVIVVVVVVAAGIIVVVVFATGIVVVVGNLLLRSAICCCRASYRLLRVPRVAAARANVIIPNKPTIPNAINIGVVTDPPKAINTFFYQERSSRFY
jgi:hypothetical protein